MKIGIDISQIVYPGTGVAMYTRLLVDELLKVNSGNEYILYGASLRQKKQLEAFAQNKLVRTSFWSIPPTLGTILHNDIHLLPIETFTGKLNLFHANDWLEPKTNCPKITTIHDLIIFRSPESTHPAIIATQKKTLELANKECVHIIVDSVATKNDCIELLKIPESLLSVIYLAPGNNAVAFSKKSLTEKTAIFESAKKKYQIDGPYFLAVGTRQPRKNIARLLEAFGKLPKGSCQLLIAGNYGWGENQIPMDNVKVLGFVSEEDLEGLYFGATAFVYPSLYEGFGIPILEAMAIGTPVITSNVSSMPEAGGDAAFYVDPLKSEDIAEKLTDVLKLSASQRIAVIKKGLAQVKKFSWQKTATATLAIYNQFAT